MTSKEQAAMQQALEALDVLLTEPMAKIAADKAEALLLRAAPALREALAEPQVDWKEEALRLGGLNAKHVGELRKLKAEQAEQEPVTEWEKLKDPQTLFVNLNRGFPAQLTHGHLLHLLNKTEQAEQEPVAWVREELQFGVPWNVYYASKCFDDLTPLYTRPVRTKDLTELLDVMVGMANYIDKLGGDSKGFRAVIAADREKNK